MLTWVTSSVRHHWLLFLGSLITLLVGSSIIGACLQLMFTAFSAPQGGFTVQVTGSGTLDLDGEPTVGTEHFSPLGSGREDLLSVAGTVGIVCLFLTAATLSMTVQYLVVARVREFGALRLLGATSDVLRRVLTLEVLVLSLVASALGAIVSVLLAPPVLSALTTAGYVSTAFDQKPSILGVLLTIAVTVGVAALGARSGSARALDVSPVLASRGAIPPRRISPRRWLVSVAGLMAVCGFALLAVGSPGDGAIGLGLLLPMLMGGCLAMLGPVLVPAAVGVLSRIAERVVPTTPVSFAAASARSSRDATPAVALPVLLFIGIAGAVMTTLASDAYAVTSATRAQIRADVVATSLTPDFSADKAAAAGATAVDAPLSSTFIATDRDTAIELSAEGVDPASLVKTRAVTTTQGSLAAVGDKGVAISRAEASDDGYRVGQTLTFVTADRKRHSLPIVAIVDGSPEIIPQVMVSDEWMAANVPDASRERAFFTGPNPAALAEKISAVPGVGAASDTASWADSSARDYAANSIRGVAVVLLPAALFCMLGVGNAVLMWLSTRRSEMTALARIGMTSGQRRASYVWWALLVAGSGALLGTMIVWATDAVVRFGLFGSPVAHLDSFPLPLLAGAIALVLVSACVPVLWMCRSPRSEPARSSAAAMTPPDPASGDVIVGRRPVTYPLDMTPGQPS
jgi:putative ABC transport system permease protein